MISLLLRFLNVHLYETCFNYDLNSHSPYYSFYPLQGMQTPFRSYLQEMLALVSGFYQEIKFMKFTYQFCDPVLLG
jgi:hypothetical protein